MHGLQKVCFQVILSHDQDHFTFMYYNHDLHTILYI